MNPILNKSEPLGWDQIAVFFKASQYNTPTAQHHWSVLCSDQSLQTLNSSVSWNKLRISMVTLSPGERGKGGGQDQGPGQKCPYRLPAASLRGTTIFFYVLPENSCIYIYTHTFIYMYSVYIKVCIFIFNSIFVWSLHKGVTPHNWSLFHVTLEQL